MPICTSKPPPSPVKQELRLCCCLAWAVIHPDSPDTECPSCTISSSSHTSSPGFSMHRKWIFHFLCAAWRETPPPGWGWMGAAAEQSPPWCRICCLTAKVVQIPESWKVRVEIKNRSEFSLEMGVKPLILQQNQVDRELKTHVVPESWRLFHKKWLYHCLIFCISKLENMSLKQRQCHLIKKKISK